MSNNKLAISLIIISVFFGTVMLSFLKIVQEDVNVYVAGFFRFFLGLLIILPYIIKNNSTVLKTTHLKKHFLRAILGLPAMLLYFSALVLLPIEKLTAISFVVPLMVTILAVFFLGEKIYIYRTLALILGFSGMLVIIRPGFVDISIGVYMVLFSANLHPTDAPKIKRQKLIDASGNLYDAISVICNNPLANNVPDRSAAGTLILSKIKIKINEATINISKLK